MTEKVAAKNADPKAINKPSQYPLSKLKITKSPEITTSPNPTSYHLIFDLLKTGSTNAVQSEVVAIPARQTDAVETLADQKKRIQCKEMIKPVAVTFTICLGEISKDSFLNKKRKATPIEAINVR